MPIADHALRFQLANELHARPFARVAAPGHAVLLAVKQPDDASNRDRSADTEHLHALLDRFGAQRPKADATHYFGDLGPFWLKWESHTEFVTYTAIRDGVEARPFDKAAFEVFPDDWLADAPGQRITSSLIRFEAGLDDEAIAARLDDWFVAESLAASAILDGSAVLAGDFRIDSAGHMRFAVFARPGTGAGRMGRILQRVTEIEVYKTMSMLGFARARLLSPQLGAMDLRMGALMEAMTAQSEPADETLSRLLEITAELESLLSQSSFRFAATRAYAALVSERVSVLREERFEGRQTFQEFITRRFLPAMRTVEATETRLRGMAERAARAGELLRTRVDVERSAQNQKLLEGMNRRADLQLRLQETVEGLSVVAISYYSVNLAVYLLSPLAEGAGVSKTILTASLVPAVVLVVLWMVRRIRRALH